MLDALKSVAWSNSTDDDLSTTAVADEAIVGNDLAPACLLEPSEANLLLLPELGHVRLRTVPIGRYTTFIAGPPLAGRRAGESAGS